MPMRCFTVAGAVLLLSLAAVVPALAAAPSAADKAQMQAELAEFRDFKLTPEFIHRREAYMEAAAKDPCKYSLLGVLNESQGKQHTSIDQMAAHYDAKPGVHALLERNDLTARDMVLGTYTLMGAALQDLAKKHPEMVEGNASGFEVSSANMAVYHKYKDEMHQHRQKIAQQELKQNGGKLPACLTGGQ